jgi:hypothetical protein
MKAMVGTIVDYLPLIMNVSLNEILAGEILNGDKYS